MFELEQDYPSQRAAIRSIAGSRDERREAAHGPARPNATRAVRRPGLTSNPNRILTDARQNEALQSMLETLPNGFGTLPVVAMRHGGSTTALPTVSGGNGEVWTAWRRYIAALRQPHSKPREELQRYHGRLCLR